MIAYPREKKTEIGVNPRALILQRGARDVRCLRASSADYNL